MSVETETTAALDQYWRTALEIHKRVGCWSKTSVRHVLRQLVGQGAIEDRVVPTPSGFVFEYRQRPSAPSEYPV